MRAGSRGSRPARSAQTTAPVRACVRACVCVYIYVHMYKDGDCGRYHTPERALHTRPHAINDVYMHAHPHASAHDLSTRARTSSKTCSCDESCPKHRSKLKAARTLLCSTTSWLVSPSTCTGHAPSSRPAMRVCVCVYALGTRPRRAQLVAPVQSHGWMPALTQTRLHTHAHTSTDIRTHTRMRTCRPHPPNDADVALELLRVD